MELDKKSLSVKDIDKIKKTLSVSIKGDYGPTKEYKIYDYDHTNEIYSLPLYWASNNLENKIFPFFKPLKETIPGRFLITPRSHQVECMKECKKELDKEWGGGLINLETGGGKCHGINSEIMMFNGSNKKVQDIKVGDCLMGDDSKERKVLSLVRGRDEMYEIIPDKGEKYIVNKEHILCLKTSNQEILEISVKDYLKLPTSEKKKLKGYKVPVEFKEKPLPLEPYLFGFNVGNSIPDIYKYNSTENRLKLLAGIIDKSGNLKNRGFEIVLKNESLTNDVIYLCRSIGFSFYKSHETSFKLCILGEIEKIPIMSDKNRTKPGNSIKDVLVSDIKEVKSIGIGNYYGFNVSGNKRYLLGDFTVTHNSIQALMIYQYKKLKTLIVVNTIELLQQWTKSINTFLPDVKVGKIQGKIFDTNQKDIVIGMLQTISMKSGLNKKLFDDFGIVIYDEVQFLSAEVFSKALLKSRARYTFGLSATIERKDGLQWVFKAHIGDILYSNISTSLKQYTKIKYIFIDTPRKEKIMYDGSPNISAMVTDISEDIERTRLICKELVSLKDRNILVLSERVEHLKVMNNILGDDISGIFIGKMKQKDKDISKTKKILLATYHIASVGFDHPKLNTIVFATPRSNITQAIGRIYRKIHEITPMIIDVVDNYSVFPYQYKKRKSIYSKSIREQEQTNECLFD